MANVFHVHYKGLYQILYLLLSDLCSQQFEPCFELLHFRKRRVLIVLFLDIIIVFVIILLYLFLA